MSSNSLKQYNSKEIHIAMVDPELRPNPQTPTKDSPAGMFSAIQKRKWKVWLNMADQNNVKIWLRTSPLINDWTLYTPNTPITSASLDLSCLPTAVPSVSSPHGIARNDTVGDAFIRTVHNDGYGNATTAQVGLGNGLGKDASNNIEVKTTCEIDKDVTGNLKLADSFYDATSMASVTGSITTTAVNRPLEEVYFVKDNCSIRGFVNKGRSQRVQVNNSTPTFTIGASSSTGGYIDMGPAGCSITYTTSTTRSALISFTFAYTETATRGDYNTLLTWFLDGANYFGHNINIGAYNAREYDTFNNRYSAVYHMTYAVDLPIGTHTISPAVSSNTGATGGNTFTWREADIQLIIL